MNRVISTKVRSAGWAVGLIALASATAAEAKNWGAWSAPASIETLPGSSTQLNTPAVDGCASLSPDGLELYFTSSRAGGLGAVDIWVARRSSAGEGFGPPENLGAPINSSSAEFCPTMTQGKRLYFSSARDDGQGDLYVSRLGKNGWSVPQNLGTNINSASVEESASIYEDEEGREVLVFSSRRSGRGQIYQSVAGGPAQLVAGGVITVSNADQRPSVRKDGLEIFWDSTRFGTLGNSDLWTATRSSTSDPWGTAVHLQSLSSAGPPGTGFTLGYDARPFISWEASTLIFGSVRSGGEGVVDLYFATREKVAGN